MNNLLDDTTGDQQPRTGATRYMLGSWLLPMLCLAGLDYWTPALQFRPTQPHFLFWILPILGGAIGGYRARTAARAAQAACWATACLWALWMSVYLYLTRVSFTHVFIASPWNVAFMLYLFPYLCPLLFVGATLGGLASTLAHWGE